MDQENFENLDANKIAFYVFMQLLAASSDKMNEIATKYADLDEADLSKRKRAYIDDYEMHDIFKVLIDFVHNNRERLLDTIIENKDFDEQDLMTLMEYEEENFGETDYTHHAYMKLFE